MDIRVDSGDLCDQVGPRLPACSLHASGLITIYWKMRAGLETS